jgi:hypothetical protein
MTEADVIKAIKEGSLDEWLDLLDFAPSGVMDLVKQLSVTIPLNDYNKRNALKEKIGFDVDAAIRNWEAEKAAEKAPAEEAPKRRVQPETKSAPARRTTGKYKVIAPAE